MSNATLSPTMVTTGVVRLSYAHIWEPNTIQDGQEAKYSVSLIIPKSDKKTIKQISAAVEAAKQLGINEKFGGKLPGNLKLPLRDGDTEKEDAIYADSYFVNASSKKRPGIVGRDKMPIEDKAEVYSGCYAIVNINFYAYNVNGNRGIACGLNHIMKVKDGEYLGGGVSIEDAFAGIEIDDDFDDLLD